MAYSSTDDLEYNDFYKALQTQFQALYDRAQSDCWLVCVPCSSSLPPSNQINYNFVAAHLLEPSKLYRDEFTSLLVSGKRRKWRLENDKLQADDNSHRVKVLSEELAYNKSLKHYRLFVIDQPLVEGVQRQRRRPTNDDLLAPRKTVPQHLRLLESFQKHQQIKHEVDKKIDMFRENYMVLERFLSDASNRVEALVKQAYSSYVIEHSTDKRLQDRRVQEGVWLAAESYIIKELHPKVYPVICKRHEKDDKSFIERCKQLRTHLVPTALGISKDYNCPYSVTLGRLAMVKNCQSPIEKLYCLQDALDAIQTDAQAHFKMMLRIGEPSPLPSDDLISLLATIIIQANLDNFLSDIYYMEYFHWPFTDGEKLSFVLVTVRAAVEFIKGPDVDKFLPKTKQSSPSVRHGSLSYNTPSVPPSLLELHQPEEEPSLEDTLAKLTRLKFVDDEIISNPQNQDSQSMGPFFEQLAKSDGVMSSTDYSPSKRKF